jgi:hypothetical protein
MTDFDPTQHPRGNALNDGQFALKTQSPPERRLTDDPEVLPVPVIAQVDFRPTWFDDLPAWPASRPEPVVTLSFDGEQVDTDIEVGEIAFKVWQAGNGDHYNTLNDNFGRVQKTGWPDEDAEAVVEWADAVHRRIHGMVESVTHVAVSEEVTKAILALAVDKPYEPSRAPIYTAAEMEDDAPKRGVDRAERGLSRWFAQRTGSVSDTDEEALQGALTDLHHWADMQGLDFGEVLDNAERMHRNEVDRPQM